MESSVNISSPHYSRVGEQGERNVYWCVLGGGSHVFSFPSCIRCVEWCEEAHNNPSIPLTSLLACVCLPLTLILAPPWGILQVLHSDSIFAAALEHEPDMEIQAEVIHSKRLSPSEKDSLVPLPHAYSLQFT